MRAGFRPDIQGLRAIAVVAVVLYHARLPLLGGGFAGVDVFFVISGFLIGGHLLTSLRETGRVDLPHFYARRARRILPASLVVVLLTVLASLLFAAPVRLPEILGDAAAAVLSVPNVRFAIEQTDYLAGTAPSPLQHFWSLGVEEQFYLALPVLLLALWALLRGRRAGLIVALAALSVASFVLMLALGPDDPWTFFGLASRAWELGAGVLLAAVAAQVPRLPAAAAHLATAIGLAGLVASLLLLGAPGVVHPGPATLLPVLATCLVIGGGSHPAVAASPLRRLWALPPVAWLGAVSYSLYLVHWPLLALAQEQAGLDDPLPLAATLALAAAAVPLAALLHHLVERPALRSHRLAGWRPRRTFAVSAALVIALAGGALAGAPAVATIPLDAGRPVAERPLTELPEGTPFVPTNLAPPLRQAEADTGVLYTEGCQQNKERAELLVCDFGDVDAETTVAVFGDSHAARWFPAVQAAFAGEPVRVISLTKSGCRSLERAEVWSAAPNRTCSDWRAAAIDYLTANPPTVLLLGNHVGRGADSDPAVESATWSAATASTLARLPSASQVVLLAETPQFAVAPPVCLSEHLDDALACAEPRTTALNPAVIDAERAVAEQSGAGFVDLNDWFCGPVLCPVIIDANLVYTDEHHVAATFSARLGPPLRQALRPWLP